MGIGMIRSKSSALKEMAKPNIDWERLDARVLQDGDVVREFMRFHTSNSVFHEDSIINIYCDGMLDDMEFMLEVIEHLAVGYDRKKLIEVLKYSATNIAMNVVNQFECGKEELAEFVKQTLSTYNDAINKKDLELKSQRDAMAEVRKIVEESDQTFTGEYKLITDTNINFYVYVFLKGTITPSGNKTHDTQCSDYYADDTDCLDISVSTGYSKLNVKSSDGYTIYYKLCTIQSAGQVQQTFSVSASIKTNLIENGCDYYKEASISLDMKVKTKQADFLEAQEYTLGFSSSLINKDLCSIGFKSPILNVSEYPNLTFTVLDATSKTMSIAAANTSITTANIPAQIEKDGEIYTITEISDALFSSITFTTEGGFYGCTNLTTVTIPNTITRIGSHAFGYCSSLTSIVIPDSVIYVGDLAFTDCTNLQYNTYSNAKYLGNSDNPYLVLIQATSKSITACTINSNCKVLAASAFAYCFSLTSITIPNSVTRIAELVFNSCRELTSVTFENTTGWHAGFTTGLSIDVSNPATNATNVKSVDGDWYWTQFYRV